MNLSGIDGLDVTGALARLMGKRALYERLVEQFAFGELADSATTAATQIHAADLTGAERTAHSLRGVAGALGATELEMRARALEDGIRHRHDTASVETLRHRVAEELTRIVSALRERIGGDRGASPQQADVDLGTLPRHVIERMHGALDAGDLDEVAEIARSFANENPDASRRLLKLCDAFDYDGLARHLDH